MTKSRAARKINAEMAAEDSYRFLWCKHKKIPPKKGMCYWYTNIQSGKKPVEYKTNHQYNKRYEAHDFMNSLFKKHNRIYNNKIDYFISKFISNFNNKN